MGNSRCHEPAGNQERGEILREQLDQIPAAAREEFTAACQHVQRIVGDALPIRSSERDKVEWHAVVDAVVALALSSSSLEELQTRLASNRGRCATRRRTRSRCRPSTRPKDSNGTLYSWPESTCRAASCYFRRHRGRTACDVRRYDQSRTATGDHVSAERYGDMSRPSPFLFEIAGKGKHRCAWTGPRSDGADARLPLISPEEKLQVVEHRASHPRGLLRGPRRTLLGMERRGRKGLVCASKIGANREATPTNPTSSGRTSTLLPGLAHLIATREVTASALSTGPTPASAGRRQGFPLLGR